MFLHQRGRSKTKACAYGRLSVEDGDKFESDSIRNQRELIRAYVQAHPELTLVNEYVDDGYSGTNFERPGFKRMMEDCESGKINCIIVKDLSRLGREFVGMGKLLERVFPQMGIRFIAINDNYDNASEDSVSDEIVIPFKNLLNDSYCRDTSTKIRSQLSVKCRRGDFIGNYAPYGYRKDEDNHNHLVVDEYAAGIVREIFQWRLDGMSAQRIAGRLNARGTLPPSEYKRLEMGTYHSGFKSNGQSRWQPVQINRILTNEVYLGHMVQGKRQKINYKVKEIRNVEPEKWIRVEDTHEAIITQQMFSTVQKVMLLDTCAGDGQEVVPRFSGIVECGSCHQSMVRRSAEKNGKKYFYLHCSTYKKNREECTSHIISEEELAKVVLADIQAEIAKICDLESKIQEIDEIPRGRRQLNALTGQIEMLDKEIDKYSHLRRQLYEDKVAGIVSDSEYLEFNRTFTQKISAAKKARQDVCREYEMLLDMDVKQLPWIDDFKKYKNLQELNRRVLVELVEKIIVINKEHIVIRYRFHEEIESVLNYCKECTAKDEEAVKEERAASVKERCAG